MKSLLFNREEKKIYIRSLPGFIQESIKLGYKEDASLNAEKYILKEISRFFNIPTFINSIYYLNVNIPPNRNTDKGTIEFYFRPNVKFYIDFNKRYLNKTWDKLEQELKNEVKILEQYNKLEFNLLSIKSDLNQFIKENDINLTTNLGNVKNKKEQTYVITFSIKNQIRYYNIESKLELQIKINLDSITIVNKSELFTMVYGQSAQLSQKLNHFEETLEYYKNSIIHLKKDLTKVYKYLFELISIYFKSDAFIQDKDSDAIKQHTDLEEIDLLLLLDRNNVLEIEFHSKRMNIDSHSQLHKKE